MELLFNPDCKYKIRRSEILKLPEFEEPRIEQLSEDEFLIDFDEDELNMDLIKQSLLYLLNPSSGIIDGDKVKDLIFPTKGEGFPDFDVFISHSHNDEDKAKHLAEYLRKECGKQPFLDSYVWSSADELMMCIDDKYSRIPRSSLLSYEKVQYSSSHVHTMLSMAILEMIARCESFIFIESSESIDYNVLRKSGTRTQSPWLYQELQYVRMLSAKYKSGHIREGMFSDITTPLIIQYGANLDDFIPLTAFNINECFS